MCTIWGKIKKLTWLQAYDLGDVGVIWCNSLSDSLFQILCDEFCRLCAYCYSHITSHVSQVFASFTHYTSYSLLNIVHVIVCVFRSDQLSLQILWVLMQNIFGAWEIKGRMFENLNFGKTRFKSCVLEKHFISESCILFLIFNALRNFFKNRFIFFKNFVFPKFWLIQSVFWSIEIVFKIFMASLSVSINRMSRIRFLKIQIWLIQITFSKAFQNFFSLSNSTRLHNNFFVVFLLISCKVSLSISRYVHITLSFSFIFSFSCIERLFSDLAYFGVFDGSNLILWNWSLGFCSRML